LRSPPNRDGATFLILQAASTMPGWLFFWREAPLLNSQVFLIRQPI